MTIDRIRAFNRFYTRKIGLTTNRFLKSEYSLVQARLLFELNRTEPTCAVDLVRKFGLSADYVSKIVSKFETQGLVTRTPSPGDARKQILVPTAAGRRVDRELKQRSNAHIARMIADLPPGEIRKLTEAMKTIEGILDPDRAPSQLVAFRSHRPGDIGTVIHRHGVLYAREYGFNHEFDAYVALGMARFIQAITPREHLWIAEIRGRFVGSVAIVRCDDRTAQLRWLIVEPAQRGRGIGRQLVAEAIRFAREANYRTALLWTIDFLHCARRLYAEAGFHLTETKGNHVWGRELIEECWQLELFATGENITPD